MTTWIEEFGADYAVPPEVLALVAQGVLFDQSWHNDVSPSFSHRDAEPDADHDLRLWVEHPQRNMREMRGSDWARFVVSDLDGTPTHWFETDDITTALDALARKAASIHREREADNASDDDIARFEGEGGALGQNIEG